MKISVVTTLYMSESSIEEFHARTVECISKITNDFELIYVDDGSPDNSYKKSLELRENEPKLKILKFSRNFGHHRAVYAGLSHASGDYVFLIDSDLQEEPELLQEFYEYMKKNPELDSVYGVEKDRNSNFKDKIAQLYYSFFNFLSDYAYQENNLMTVRLMKKNLVKAFISHKDKELYLAPVLSLSGFNQQSIPVTKLKPKRSTYTFIKRYNLFINAILSFSSKPLYFVFYTGLFITSFSFLFAIYLIISRLMSDTVQQGWSSVMASIWIIGGIIITFLGLIAIYVNKIYTEVKDRPLYVISRKHGFK